MKWTKSEINQLKAMRKKEISAEQIAEKLGRSHQSVRNKINLLIKKGEIAKRKEWNKKPTAPKAEAPKRDLRKEVQAADAMRMKKQEMEELERAERERKREKRDDWLYVGGIILIAVVGTWGLLQVMP